MTSDPRREVRPGAPTRSEDPRAIHRLLADGAIIVEMTDADDQPRTGFRCTVTLVDRHGYQHLFTSDCDLLAAISDIGRCCTCRLG